MPLQVEAENPFSNKTVQKINDNLTDWMKTAKPDIQELSFLLLGYIYMTGLEDGLYEVNLLKAEAYLSEAKEISQSITEKTPFYLFNALEAHRYHMLGQIENCESRLELAEALWEEIKNDPKQMAWLHGARGFALFECAFQNYEEALHSFDEGLKLNPEEPLWHYMKGLILARLRRNKKNKIPTQDELESLYKAISLSNEDNADYIITYTLSLSSIWFNNKRDNSLKKKILGYLEKLQKCENTAYILLNCSKVYRYLGNKGEMKKCLLQADNITEGKNGHILHQLGLYFWRMERDFEKAKEYLKKVEYITQQ
ncbi:protein IFIT1 homolog B-like [Tachypleus tridentatus]|uniref:protein IFIT1 homolog B-like n=1 Tax=Tachypleus tridentatus TaxID=6853 RepID=UPI003FD5F428